VFGYCHFSWTNFDEGSSFVTVEILFGFGCNMVLDFAIDEKILSKIASHIYD
jgi:hypothetical protein